MKVKCGKKPWPPVWGKLVRGVRPVLEKDLRLPGGGLRLKLLVFKNKMDLYRFWSKAEPTRHGGYTQDCLGVCSDLSYTVEDYPGKGADPVRWHEMDRRYFAVMGLCVGHLGMEVVTHESVHAGFAYARRRGKRPWDDRLEGLEEEKVCYPAGAVARMVVGALNDAGLYAKGVSLDKET